MNRWTDEQMDRYIDGQMNKGKMNRWTDEQMNR